MNPVAFLFPGQGSQRVGMAGDLYQRFPEAREIIDAADRMLGFSLSEIMFGRGAGGNDGPGSSGDTATPSGSTSGRGAGVDPAEALKQTAVTQPALYVHSMASLSILHRAGSHPSMVAGHSLGECTALAASGAISFEDGLRLVRRRGELMAGVGHERPGSMAAILNLPEDAVSALCQEATEGPLSVVTPANVNAPGQVVISGDVDALDRAMQKARDLGARRVVPLPVSGAFHSPLMEHMREQFEQAVSSLEIKPPSCPVYQNVTATATRDPDQIRQALVDQLTAPVLWMQQLRTMHADGAERFIEVGTGNVLSGLVRRTLRRSVEVIPAGTVEDLEALTSAVA